MKREHLSKNGKNNKYRKNNRRTEDIEKQYNGNGTNNDADMAEFEHNEDSERIGEDAFEVESTLKEWDFTDDEDIQEFLSRDYDVVAESRRRSQSNRTTENREYRSKTHKNIKKRNTETKKNAVKKSGNPILSKVKNLWDKWIETYRKNTMQILFSTLTGLVVLLVVAVVATYPYDNQSKSGDDVVTGTESVSTLANEETTKVSEETTTDTEEGNIQAITPETEDSAVHNLIEDYIDAAYIKADMEAVKLVVDDMTNISADLYKNRQKYIEKYENIKCYKLESAIANAYIVFVTYDAKLYNITTLAPAAETIIVKYNQEKGQFFVHNMTEKEKLDVYFAKDSQLETLNQMSTEVVKRLDAALASDAELKKVYNLMNNINSQQETTAAPAQ